MALAVVRTLWSEGSLRCVLLMQLQPRIYAVQLSDGTRVIHTELVDDSDKAIAVAVHLWDQFSESANPYH